ncbi:MAG: amino acid adenylation domain-containing protein [Chloroflexi bacterium]|nr:amino acid adenylation domain-containing protein [Chloroflexota bacterium]MCI0580052.1 amino acid adenylation domain-containing protein [Chloroflexota bacterium]MCI0649767.1 amino acid adenylation domain-containing protein [Chloroflexota bacterium]MCI0731614.1 amino acid adenylation domain-containing protein [Chloroflexota bacterium]
MIEQTIEGFRLSPQQRHLWELQQSDGSRFYRTQGAIAVEGALDPTLLQTALAQVAARHEILRTTFQQLPGMNIPLQVVGERPQVSLKAYDLRGLERQAQEVGLQALWQEMNQNGLHQSNGAGAGPLSLALARLAEQKHLLLVDIPSLYADAATLKILVRELGRAYQAGQPGEAPDDEPVQYIDLSEWQNDLLEDEDMAAGRSYWLGQDLAALQTLNLPFENRVRGTSAFTPQFISYPIAQDLANQVATLAQQVEVPAATVWLACWQLLLSRLGGQADVVVGVTVDGRKYDELAGALGLLAKHVPVRGQVRPGHSFLTLLDQVHKASQEAHKWQECFAWEVIHPETNGRDAPHFFPYCFDFVELGQAAEVKGLTFSLEWGQTCFDRFTVKLVCNQVGEQIQTTWWYDANSLSAPAVQRLAERTIRVVEQVTQAPNVKVEHIDVLSPTERQEVLVAWNATHFDYPQDASFPELFAAQVAQTPEAAALIWGERHLTYRELNGRANQLAHYLQKQEIGLERPVGVCLEHSPELLVGLLGILKAGGAFVPLDPAYPPERLAFMVQDARLPFLLTQERILANLPELDTTMICLDADWEPIAREDEQDLATGVTAGHLAYVMYTSGSTGRPKGVMISQRSLVNYLCWVNATLLGGERCNLPATTKPTFDAALKQLFAPLLRGDAVWLLAEQLVTQPAGLWQAFASRPAVAFNCVPSLWQALLDTLDAAQNPTLGQPLTTLLIGGEALTPELVRRSLRSLPHLRIWNLYGPTEATANASAAPITLDGDVTIGRPIANTQLYILDEHLQPAPAGVPGQLYVGGAALARGYLNRPGLTAEKFIPNPFSHEPGSRLYHTGDLARYLPDGRIEYLGRADYQVKVRGHRIELGEIEAALQEHAEVRQCVVTVQEKASGEKRLVAYFVPDPGATPSLRALRRFLSARLPEYMLPSAFIMLDALPLMPNGKVDRRALPAPDQARARPEESFAAPRTPVEEIIAGIWAQMLNVQRVGIHDDFFELGGDSILSIRTTALLRSTFHMEIPVRTLFEAPTVAQYAQALTAYEKKPGQVEKVAGLLKQVEAMSPEEVREALQKKKMA